MLDTLCKHHLSGAFTSGHETRVHGTLPMLSGPVMAERLPGTRPALGPALDAARVGLGDGRRVADLDQSLAVRDALQAAKRSPVTPS